MKMMTGVIPKETMEISEILASDLYGQMISVNGAVHTVRDMGEVAFVVLRKREGLLQCVYEEGVTAIALKELKEGGSQGLGAIAGAAETYWGKNKGRSMEGNLVKWTKILTVVFFLLAIVLNLDIF